MNCPFIKFALLYVSDPGLTLHPASVKLGEKVAIKGHNSILIGEVEKQTRKSIHVSIFELKGDFYQTSNEFCKIRINNIVAKIRNWAGRKLGQDILDTLENI